MDRTSISVADRFLGGLLALACGDALGAGVEFMSRDEIRRRFGKVTEMTGGGPFNVEPGEGTDDTGMALAVAEGLLEDDPDPREAVGRHLVAWFQAGPKDVGNTVRTALTNYLACGDWNAAVARTRSRLRDMAAGNGSLVRTLAVSYAFLDEPERMMRESARLSEMTHPHELPTLACTFYNEFVRLLALGMERAAAFDQALERVERQGPLVSFNSRMVFLRQLRRVPELGYTDVRASGFVLDALVAGLWVFLRASDLEAALVEAVGLGDDADSVGALVGGMAGTYWGAGAVPGRWRSALKEAARIEDVARRLARRVETARQATGEPAAGLPD